ncbi:MAG: HD domain-containing protein [Desulfurococcaceae archaeon]
MEHAGEEFKPKLFMPYNGQIRDPIHGYIDYIKELEGAVMDSWVMQRLRYIYQLQAAHFVYPGATHTRFSHSLGVMHLSYKYITLVLRSSIESLPSNERSFATRYYREITTATRLLGLLHDIGHGPFSHAFDKHVYMQKKFLNYRVGNHEVLGYVLYKFYVRDLIEKALVENRSTLELDVDTTLELLDAGMKPSTGVKMFTDLLSKNVLSENDFFVPEKHNGFEVVSRIIVRDYIYTSDIMDYLKRDSYFTGVPMGQINDDWIIRNSYVLEKNGRLTIGVASKALDEIARLFDARKLMYKYVYLHPVNVAFIETLGSLLPCIKSFLADVLEKVINDPGKVQHYMKLTDHSIYSKLQELLINPEASECEDKSYVKKALETLFYKRKPLWKQVTRLTYDLREASVLYGEIGMRVQELIKDKIRQEVSASLRSKNVEPQNIEVVFDKIDVYPTAGSEILDKIEIVDVKNGKLVYVESIDLNDFAEKAGLKPEALVTIYVDRDVYKRLESDDISKVIDVSKSIVESSIKGKRKEIPETS